MLDSSVCYIWKKCKNSLIEKVFVGEEKKSFGVELAPDLVQF